MRNMLALFAAVVLTVVGLGWYLDWYKVRSQPASVPGHHGVGIDINTNKIGVDLQKGEQKLQQMLDNKAKEEAKKLPDAKKTTDNLMLPSPPASPGLTIDTGKGSALEVQSGDKGPMFQFHTDKGTSVQVGGDKAPTFQIGGDKGPMIQFGSDKKP
jgi:hypothetical protein